MTQSLPCPNPACKHVFALREIRGATKLTCPRCARVFRFVVDARGNTRLVAPRPDIDVELVKPQELTSPRPPTPVLSPAGIGTGPSAVVDVERHRRRKPGSRLSVVMGILVAVLVVTLVLGGFFMFRPSPEEKHESPGKRFSAGQPASRHDPDDGPPREPPRPTEFLRGAQCEVEVPIGVWAKFKASEEDEQADLFLQGRRLEARDDPTKNASVLVVALKDQKGNLVEAAQMARNRLEGQRRLRDATARLVPVAPSTESEPVGDRRGQVAELKLEIGQQPQKYLLLAVAKDADKLFVIRCECEWDSRQLWQSDFREIVKTFRINNMSGS